MIGLILLLLFVVVQGGAVFITAYLALIMLKRTSPLAKLLAMTVSYLGWVTFTIGGYVLLGGDGGLMDGFGMILMLCSSAFISSFVYLLVWGNLDTTGVIVGQDG